MRKTTLLAGTLLIAALLFASPSKADSVVNFEMTGHGLDITFTLPQTFTPANIIPVGVLQVFNVPGTLFAGGGTYPFAIIQIGNAGYGGVTNYWDFGSQTQEFGLYIPGLYTKNADGTYTLNPGTFQIGDYNAAANGGRFDYTVSATLADVPPVGTPEPASLVLLGVGGLALAAMRRRKSA